MNQQPSDVTDQNARPDQPRLNEGSEEQVSGKGVGGKRLTRRRFASAGFAAPVILTLANRPAFGAVCTVSGFASTNPSGVARHGSDSCGGRGPDHWTTDGNWPGAFRFGPDTPFRDVFGGSSEMSLKDVLAGTDGKAANAVAALLSTTLEGYTLSADDVVNLYTDGGFYGETGFIFVNVEEFFAQTFN